MPRSRPANPLWKRLQRRWRVWRGYADAKTHEVDWVWEQGVRYKRVRFDSRVQSEAVAEALQAMAPTHRFPSLVRAEGDTLWVEYLKKDRFSSIQPEELVSFFVELYAYQAATATPQPAANLLATLAADLKGLVKASLLSESQCQQLDRLAHQVAPAMVSVGFDYIDAVQKNFLVSGNRVMGIDVEALLGEQWLGVGLAKAEYRGLINPSLVITSLGEPFGQQYPLVRLAFLTSYFRQKLEQGKRGHIHLQALLKLI